MHSDTIHGYLVQCGDPVVHMHVDMVVGVDGSVWVCVNLSGPGPMIQSALSMLTTVPCNGSLRVILTPSVKKGSLLKASSQEFIMPVPPPLHPLASHDSVSACLKRT